jgi:amino acid transporter
MILYLHRTHYLIIIDILMNTSQIKSRATRALLPVLVLAPTLAGAATPTQDTRVIGEIPQVAGTNQSTDLVTTIQVVIQWALGFIGIVIFIIFLFAGFEYATAGGDETKAGNATKRMINAVIGLIIIFFAFVASNAVLSFVFPGN